MRNMKTNEIFAVLAAVTVGVACAQDNSVAKFDPRMAIQSAVVDTNGVKWIDGKYLPIEGKYFTNTSAYYDRLPSNVTENVNGGVRGMKNHSSGLQFRFSTTSKNLHFKWKPIKEALSMDHMPATGVSGIDVYASDGDGKWRFVKQGRIRSAKQGGSLTIGWKPGTQCLVNLPLYNGIASFTLGIDKEAEVIALPLRKSGINKPVVFYGTSITHGGCASRPGLAFPSIVGRDLDVPIANLGFSGSGRMEFEMSEHLAAIDASCYVLDCLWNMGGVRAGAAQSEADLKGVKAGPEGVVVLARYEPFIRNLRAKRPGVPIVMAEQCDVFCNGPNAKDRFIRKLYEKLIAEGWKNLVYLPKTDMYTGDREGTVDGCHPNDLGMMSMSKAFGKAVKEALDSVK
jgi:lysophospholipase L1-like esterase